MLISSIYIIVYLAAATVARVQNVDSAGGGTSNATDRTTCVESLLPRLCMMGHVCCNDADQRRKSLTTKQKCSATPRKCKTQGGTCMRANNIENHCNTAHVPNLCNKGFCTCCIGDHKSCTPLPKCRLKGGYCYKGQSKQVRCPSGKTITNGCSGKRCTCCVPDRKCKCGRAANSNRIVGGQVVKPPNKYPWIVGIQVPSFAEGSYVCGGAVINNLYVITAAHCLIDFDGWKRRAKDILVGVADHNQYSTDDDVEGVTALVAVRRVIIHEGYGQGPNNDIGLLELKKPLDLVSHRQLKPVCLPTRSSKTYEGTTGVIYGWGVKDYRNDLQDILQETTVPILKPSCNGKTIGSVRITPQMLCAGYKKGGKDTCLGDSGGPLTVEDNGRHVLVGITSFGEGCGLEESPGVYSRVTAFLDWIDEHTRDGSFCN